jgi:polysaccharide export outer membrane protein
MTRLALLALSSGLIAAGSVPAAGDTPADAPLPAPAASAQRSPANGPPSGAYRLRSEDVIEITVLGLAQLDKTLTVLPDGTISFPRLGTIHAAGMTTEELRAFLFKGLDRFYNNLQINVGVKSLRTDWVTVSGAVKQSGNYELRRGWTVQELLAAAGGIAPLNGPPAPDQMRATLIRANGQRIPINLDQLLSQQGTPDLPALEPGDDLVVEDLTIQVTVDGQVREPGKTVPLAPGATALDALQAAGGPTEKAALSKAFIRRGTQNILVDLRSYQEGTSSNTPLPTLQRYDTLVIPENKNWVVVFGGVNQQGRIVLPEGETVSLSQAIALAGGPVQRAKLKEVSIAQRVGEKFESKKVNVEGMFTKGDFSRDVVVQPGDFIFVPDPKERNPFPWSSILPALLFGL